MWFVAIVAIVSFAATLYMSTRRPNVPIAPSPEDTKGPTADEGTIIPVVFGTAIIESPAVTWYGDIKAVPVKENGYTIGHSYRLNMFLVICHGMLDSIRDIFIDKKSLLDTATTYNNYYMVSKDENMNTVTGHDSKGYYGAIKLNLGQGASAVNSGVAHDFGKAWGSALVGAVYPSPTFAGIATAQFGSGTAGQFTVGMSSTIRPVSFVCTRIHLRHEGITQWYDAKSAIAFGRGREETWRIATDYNRSDEHAAEYADPYFDDSAWTVAQGGFGNTGANGYIESESVYLPRSLTSIGPGSGECLWSRWDLGPMPPLNLAIECFHDDGGDLWFNGTKLTLSEVNYFRSTATVPSTLIRLNGPNVVAFRTIDCYKNGVPSGNQAYIYNGLTIGVASGTGDELRASILNDLNPIHIIRECLTNSVWGLGVVDADIDDVDFMYAADICFDERMGISILWSKQVAIQEFISEILKHIDGSLYVSRTTGKYVVKLVRGDYIAANLITLDDASIVSVSSFSRKVVGELTNSVTVKFTDQLTGDAQSVTVFEQGLITAQGGIVSTTIDYPGFSNAYIASKVALRDLRTLSSPIVSCTIVASRKAAQLNEGDAFKLTRSEYGLSGLVMRVVSIELGDGRDNAVRIQAVEDVFSTPLYTLSGNTGVSWSDPGDVAPPVAGKLLQIEEPYAAKVLRLGQAETDTIVAVRPLVGSLLVGAERMEGAIDADLYISPGGPTTAFSRFGKIDMCPFCDILATAGTSWVNIYAPYQNAKRFPTQTQTVLYYNNEKDLEFVTVGSYAVLVARNGDAPSEIRAQEFVKITALDLVAKTVTVARGCMDTVPIDYTAPNNMELLPELYFVEAYSGTNGVEYSNEDTPRAYATPSNSNGTAALPTNLTNLFDPGLTMAQRAARAYPPANLRVNNIAFPVAIARATDLVITWAGRNKQTQGSGLVDTTEASVTPETGTTYTLTLRTRAGSLLREVTGITAETYTYTNANEITDAGGALGDAYYASISCLMHFNGANGGTTFTDSGPLALTLTASGTIVTSTTQVKFGTASLLSSATGKLTCTNRAPFQFESGNFTIEVWVYVTASSASTIACYWGAGGISWYLGFDTSRFLTWYYSYNGTTEEGGWATTSPNALPLNAWAHVAVIRSGGTITIYINGTSVKTFSVGTNSLASPVQDIVVADELSSAYLDDLRITKGIARTIVVPTIEYAQTVPGSLLGNIAVTLKSMRSGLDSFTSQKTELFRPGFGRNFGKFFGGGTV